MFDGVRMNKKKVFLLLFSLVFMISLFAGAASAQQRDSFLPEPIYKFSKFLFVDLSDMAKSPDNAFVIYAKFLFFLLVFSVLFWGASHIPNMNKNISGTITFLFALISSVLIPKSLIIFIFNSYSTLIGFFFAFVPFIIGLILAHRVFSGEERWQRMMRAVIYIAMAVFTFALVQTLRGFNDPLYLEVAKWAEVGAFISLIVGIAAMIGGIGRGAGADGGGWPFGRGGGGSSGTNGSESTEKTSKEMEEDEVDSMKLGAEEMKELKNVYNAVERLKSALLKNAVSDAFRSSYNAEVDKILELLQNMESLDEKIKTYIKRVLRLGTKAYRKIKSGYIRPYDYTKAAKRLRSKYARVNLVEDLIENVEKRLKSTKDLPSIKDGNTASVTSPEIKALDGCMNDVKELYNQIVLILKLDRVVINEIK